MYINPSMKKLQSIAFELSKKYKEEGIFFKVIEIKGIYYIYPEFTS